MPVLKFYFINCFSPEGYLEVNKILLHKIFRGKYNTSDIERVVNNNDKKRFKLRRNLSTNCLEIKANQGHTISEVTDADLTPITQVFIYILLIDFLWVHCMEFGKLVTSLDKSFNKWV